MGWDSRKPRLSVTLRILMLSVAFLSRGSSGEYWASPGDRTLAKTPPFGLRHKVPRVQRGVGISPSHPMEQGQRRATRW